MVERKRENGIAQEGIRERKGWKQVRETGQVSVWLRQPDRKM